MSRNSHRGFTLVELMAYIAVLGIIILIIATTLTITYKTSTNLNLKTDAQETVTDAMRRAEKVISNANEIIYASSTTIRFIADINTWPEFDENGDPDGDGKINREDPDIDNDSTNYSVGSSSGWTVGYNLKDDDDDNDGNIDMEWQISFSGNSIDMDYSHNGEPWGNHADTLMTGILNGPIFTYYGSTNDLMSFSGSSIDTDSNGTVTESEIDNAGNGNGELDTQDERDYIVMIKFRIEVDKNNDGKADFATETAILPPMLYMKRRP